jgi:hypothetical protein
MNCSAILESRNEEARGFLDLSSNSPLLAARGEFNFLVFNLRRVLRADMIPCSLLQGEFIKSECHHAIELSTLKGGRMGAIADTKEKLITACRILDSEGIMELL